ncbi:MAG: hypothetical protein DSY75_02035 [Alteromonas sp.]|nr:MAG: hypothetical protein DSY75_02035 [Alteromonas sp.]
MKTSLSAYISLKKERETSSVNCSQNLNMCVAIGVGEISFFVFIFIKSMVCFVLWEWFAICTFNSTLAR